jgi:hypothetical protein
MGEDCGSAGSDGTTDEGGGFRQCAGGFSCGAMRLLAVERPERSFAQYRKYVRYELLTGIPQGYAI